MLPILATLGMRVGERSIGSEVAEKALVLISWYYLSADSYGTHDARGTTTTSFRHDILILFFMPIESNKSFCLA